MTIALLTSDDLKEPSREVTQLAKLNEMATQVNTVSDGGAMTAASLVVRTDSADLNRSLSVHNRGIDGAGDGAGLLFSLAAGAATAVEAVSIDALSENTTFTGATADGKLSVKVALNGTLTERLTITSAGVVAVAGSFSTTGNTALGSGAAAEVSVATGSAAKLGFYTTSPIVKQTGVAVTAEGVHAALVALGLIAA